MIQKITNGIKVSVQSKFEGSYFDGEALKFAFKYKIEIKNNNPYSVQLISRTWNIFDALNFVEIVEGDGVIGTKPIIKPFESYSYSSGCLLLSPIGSMNGTKPNPNWLRSRCILADFSKTTSILFRN